MLTDNEQFKNNLMPKLIDYYKRATENGRTNNDFDIEMVRKFLNEGGFGIKAWEDKELKDRLSYLVKKGLIEQVSNGRYRLTK